MHGARLLDASTSLAGVYCSRLFASVGAEVVVATPPGGDTLRGVGPFASAGGDATVSLPWRFLREGTTTVTLADEDPAFVDAAADYDAVLLSFDGEPEPVAALARTLRRRYPSLVVCVLSPFGLDGPYAGYRGGPLVDWASGGHLALNGEFEREPLPGGGPWVTNLVGATAAVGIQAALRAAKRDGEGDLIDIGAMEALVSAHQWSIVLYTHQGIVKRRWGNRHGEAYHPLSLHPCSDGWVCIASVLRHQWEGLCLAMDHPELLADETLYIPAVRFDRADELDVLLDEWTSGHTVDEVVDALQANHCPAGAVRTFHDLLEDPHLAARRFWTPVPELGPNVKMPAAPFRIEVEGAGDESAPGVRNAEPHAPTLLHADRRQGPLAGVRVIELSVAWAGPLAARFLGELGADVIKIEHPTARGLAPGGGQTWDPDAWEWGTVPPAWCRNGVFPDSDPGERWWNRLGHWNKMNRSKRSLCLDIKATGGREVFESLVRGADIVLNNYSPRGARSLGLEHERLRAINPKLVTVDLTGFGTAGPDAEQVSWGPILDVAAGLSAATGYADSGPYKQGLAFPDVAGGVHGAFAVLAALHERERTGRAVHIDLSQLEAVIIVAGSEVLEASVRDEAPPRRGACSEVVAPQGVYRCAGDDEWLAISVEQDDEWKALVTVVGPSLEQAGWHALPARRRDHDRIDEVIAQWTSRRTKFDACRSLQAAGVRAFPVMTNRDLVEDPHLAARGYFVTLDHPDTGSLVYPGFPFRFERNAVTLTAAPGLGEDNDAILSELGWGAAACKDLEANGALATAPPS